ncbi:hypothetical protein ANN_23274 [Periplaneta americana]|uniref:Ig-like domain-containing protein n=1 Tax=Periplaneta americana TaxID=6978 RepID=A0ABQ8SLV9_PERAM|nr:hypothetical protein ANN_23274 [Periplaneta americana]
MRNVCRRDIGLATTDYRRKECESNTAIRKSGRQERSRDILNDIREYNRKRNDIDRLSLAFFEFFSCYVLYFHNDVICSSSWKRQYFYRLAPLLPRRAYIHTSKQTETPHWFSSELTCGIFVTLQVSWIRRKDYHLLTVGLATYSSDDRFFTAHVRNTQDWALHVRYAKARDGGLYECQVSTHPPSSLFVELQLVGSAVTVPNCNVPTTIYILSVSNGELLRIDRHNKIRSKIANELRLADKYEVYEEIGCLSADGSTPRADIIVTDRKKLWTHSRSHSPF